MIQQILIVVIALIVYDVIKFLFRVIYAIRIKKKAPEQFNAAIESKKRYNETRKEVTESQKVKGNEWNVNYK